MKKVLIAIVATVLLAIPSFGQYSSGGFTLDSENLYYGIRLGFTSASLSGDLDRYGSKLGLTLGGVVGLRVSETNPLFLESGLYYTERGGKKGKERVGYNNLEIPLLIKYGFRAQDVAFLPFIGPYFSYAISGKTKYTADGVTISTGSFDEHKAPTGGLKRANMGFKLGCGVEYNKMYAELGYQFGVTNVCKKDDLSARSNALFVNIGINF
ncbi:MAG: porin family protein [Phocaeicola sp.]|uniref:porin family protein n=1 Tax=Phocaeicola sp. TaxID=2773926 RepID=UPI003F9F6CF8